MPWTKEKRSAYDKEYRAKNKERLKDYLANYYLNEVTKERKKAFNARYNEKKKLENSNRAKRDYWRKKVKRIDDAMAVYHIITFFRRQRLKSKTPSRKLTWQNVKIDYYEFQQHLKAA